MAAWEVYLLFFSTEQNSSLPFQWYRVATLTICEKLLQISLCMTRLPTISTTTDVLQQSYRDFSCQALQVNFELQTCPWRTAQTENFKLTNHIKSNLCKSKPQKRLHLIKTYLNMLLSLLFHQSLNFLSFATMKQKGMRKPQHY